MKLRTAALLACIGVGIWLLTQFYTFIRYNIISRSKYTDLDSDIFGILYLIPPIFLFIFFIVFYNKLKKRSWKD